jgi:hypothetical protein
MNTSTRSTLSNSQALTSGSGAAAILAAGLGSFALGVLAFAGDKSAHVKSSLIFYKPTGPLSGITTTAILIWLLIWGVLELRWRKKTVAVGSIAATALVLLGLSLLLTFPPIVELL